MNKAVFALALVLGLQFAAPSAHACMPSIKKKTVFTVIQPGSKALVYQTSAHESVEIEVLLPPGPADGSPAVSFDHSLLQSLGTGTSGRIPVQRFVPVSSGKSEIVLVYPGGRKIVQEVDITIAPSPRGC